MNAATWVTGIIFTIVIGAFCSRLATWKGRGPVLWAILGFIFTLFALVVIAILPRKKGSPRVRSAS